jgi:hypothetical protein
VRMLINKVGLRRLAKAQVVCQGEHPLARWIGSGDDPIEKRADSAQYPADGGAGLSHLILRAARKQACKEAVVPPGPLQLAFH